MNYIPIDVANTKPQHQSGGGLPEGWYVFQVTDATEVAPESNGEFFKRVYKLKVIQGPGASNEMAGRNWSDRIRENDQRFNGHHMAIFVSCLGSQEAVVSTAQQHGGQLPAEVLHGKYYIGQLVKNGQYTNFVQRLPYSPEIWQANVGTEQQAQGGILAQQQAAPVAQAAPVQQPVQAVPQQAPVMQQPVMQQPVPTMPVPQQAPVAMPPTPGAQATPAVPTPPPPPGTPSVGQ